MGSEKTSTKEKILEKILDKYNILCFMKTKHIIDNIMHAHQQLT